MSEQHEDPEDQVSIGMFNARMAMERGPGLKVSGGRILNFERGWAIPALRWGAVHYLRIVDVEVVGACGVRFPLPLVRGQGVVFFGQGKFKRCTKCQRKVDRKP
jgi:hypothetical protein